MYATIDLSPSELGFSHPLSEELVSLATRYIQDDLNSILRAHDDSETRKYDKRRTHTPLSESTWIIKYRHNKVLITNQISDESSKQFTALYYGNGAGQICAKHMTQQRLKGWGGNWIKTKQRYSKKDGHKDKPHPFELGAVVPGKLKYYDKHNGMWMYRQCVRPIGSAIIDDFRREVQGAVTSGLERAYWEMYSWIDKDTVGSFVPDDPGMSEPVTMEEMHYWEESKTKVEKDSQDYVDQKNADIEQRMDDRVAEQELQDRARSELQKVGLENKQPKGEVVKKSIWGKLRQGTEQITDTVKDRIHKFFGV